VLSALEVFTDDLSAHLFRGSCGRPVRNFLPLPSVPGEARLTVDWTHCRGHGLCAHVVPELVQLDRQGFPVLLDTPVPPWLGRAAQEAVGMCPGLALRLAPADPAPGAGQAGRGRIGRTLSVRQGSAAETIPDLVVSEDWIAEISTERAGPGRG
jgi:ferredoxin